MFAIRPNGERAKQIIIMFYVMIGIALLELALNTWQFFLFRSFAEDPSAIDFDQATLSDQLDLTIGYIDIAAAIIAAILFIRWFRRAYYNLHAAAPGQASYEEGWAAGAWFVPILNLFRPFQIMREIWVGTQQAIPHRFPDVASPSIVGMWWAFYLGRGVLGYVLFILARQASGVDDLPALGTVGVIAAVLDIAALLIAVQMIRKTSTFEDQLWDEAQNPSDSVFAANTSNEAWNPASPS